jgi:hypothetical protein
MPNLTFFHLLVFVLSLLFLPTCKKEINAPNYDYKELPASVVINGASGIMRGAAFKSNRAKLYRISMTQYDLQDNRIGVLSFGNFEGVVGKLYPNDYKSNSLDLNFISYTSSFIDLLGDTYSLLADSSAWIAIDSIDKKQIWGRFEAHLVKDSLQNPRDLYAPDTLHLTNGKFQFEILKDWD